MLRGMINFVRLLLSLCFLLLLVVCGWCYLCEVVFLKQPAVLGHQVVVMEGKEMAPAISVSDVLITREKGSYQVMDVIFQKGTPKITRIVGTQSTGFITKQDGMADTDEALVSAQEIYGTVELALPRAGTMYHFLTSPVGLVALFVVWLVLFLLPGRGNRSRRKGRRGK